MELTPNKRQKVVGCSPLDYDRIVKLCKEHNLTQTQIVHELLENYFDSEEVETEVIETPVIETKLEVTPQVEEFEECIQDDVLNYEPIKNSTHTNNSLLGKFFNKEQVTEAKPEELRKIKYRYIDGNGQTQVKY